MNELEPYEPSPTKKALMLLACIGLLTFLLMLSCCDSSFEDPFPKGVARIIIFTVFVLLILVVGVIALYQHIQEKKEREEDDPPFG